MSDQRDDFERSSKAAVEQFEALTRAAVQNDCTCGRTEAMTPENEGHAEDCPAHPENRK